MNHETTITTEPAEEPIIPHTITSKLRLAMRDDDDEDLFYIRIWQTDL